MLMKRVSYDSYMLLLTLPGNTENFKVQVMSFVKAFKSFGRMHHTNMFLCVNTAYSCCMSLLRTEAEKQMKQNHKLLY